MRKCVKHITTGRWLGGGGGGGENLRWEVREAGAREIQCAAVHRPLPDLHVRARLRPRAPRGEATTDSCIQKR